MPVLSHGEGEAEARLLRRLQWTVELSMVILAIEAAGAFLSHSLSLTVDAVHNLPDILAFAISWSALRGTGPGSSAEFTFGKHRREIFAGMLNGILVVAVGVVFGYEALVGLFTATPLEGVVSPLWLLAAALPTLLLRVANLSFLSGFRTRVRDLNLASVMVHLGSDVAITGALLVAGALLLLHPGLFWADPLAALFIAGVLVYESLPLLREGWEVLSERTPRGLSVEAICRSALKVPGVSDVHDVHIWSVCSTLICLTAHVEVQEMPLAEAATITQQLREKMEREFGISHATFELESIPAG